MLFEYAKEPDYLSCEPEPVRALVRLALTLMEESMEEEMSDEELLTVSRSALSQPAQDVEIECARETVSTKAESRSCKTERVASGEQNR